MLSKLKTNRYLFTLLLCIMLAGLTVMLSFLVKAVTNEAVAVPDSLSTYMEVTYSTTGGGTGSASFSGTSLKLEATSGSNTVCNQTTYYPNTVTVYVTFKQTVKVTYSTVAATNKGSGSSNLSGSVQDLVIPAGTTLWFKLLSGSDTKKSEYTVNFTSVTTASADDDGSAAYYIPSDVSGMFYYHDLDKAIAAAVASKGEIIVAASGNVSASGDSGAYVSYDASGNPTFTIPKGVKLLVPCKPDDTGSFLDSNGKSVPSVFNYEYSSELNRYLAPIFDADAPNSSYPKLNGVYSHAYCTLRVLSGTKIVVEGEMNVNSQVHASDGRDPGNPHGPYGLVELERGAEIEVADGGTLHCYGFISGVYEDGIYSWGKVVALSGSTVYELFQIRSWMLAGVLVNLYNGEYGENNSFPISQYYIQNIEAEYVIHPGAKSYAVCSIYKDSNLLQEQALIIGDENCLFKFSSGYMTRIYDPFADRITYTLSGTQANQGALILDGIKMTLNASFITMPLDSKAAYIIGLNGNMTINVGSNCTATIGSRVKMLPGSQLNVHDGGKLIVDETSGALYIYDSKAYSSSYTYWSFETFATNDTTETVNDNRNTQAEVVRFAHARAMVNGVNTPVAAPTFGSAKVTIDGELIAHGNVFTVTGYSTDDPSDGSVYTYTNSVDKVLCGTGTFVNYKAYAVNESLDETITEGNRYGELREFNNPSSSKRWTVAIPCAPLLANIVTDASALPTTFSNTWETGVTYVGYYQDGVSYWTKNTVTIVYVDDKGNELCRQGQYFVAGSDLSSYFTDAALQTNCEVTSYDGSTVMTLYALAPVKLDSNGVTTFHTTLHEAVLSAVNAGDVVTLLADVMVTTPVEISASQNITINLNGKTITYSSTVFTNYGTLALNFGGGTVINDAQNLKAVSAIKNHGMLNKLDLGGGTLKWTAPKTFVIQSSFAPLYNFKDGNATVDLGGGQIEVGYVVSVKVDQASYRVSAVFNLGNLELNKSQEGEEINRTGIVSSNVVGVKDAFFSSDGLVFTGAATVYNGGTMHIANVTINGNGSDPGHTDSACIYNRYDATMSIDNIKTYLFKGYAIINGGGTISSIIDANLQTSYYGILNFNTAVLREDGQYEAGYKGRIETITNLNITARSAYAILNKGYIGTIDGSSYIKGGGGNPRTIINYSTGAYNHVSAKAEDMPTIKKIAGTTQIVGGSSSSSTINNQGNILEISGSAKITCSTVQHAITMGEGGYIGTISGSVTIESTGGYGIYVGGTKADGLSGIGSITGGTITGTIYGIYLDGKIGTISGGTIKCTSKTAGAAINMATANAEITTISGTATISGAHDGILMVAGANIGSINGTNVSISGTASYGIYVPSGAAITEGIKGTATFSGNTAIYLGSGVNLDIGNASSNITVNGTDFGVHMAGATSGTINATISGDTAIKLENGASATTISGKVTGTAYGVYVDSATVGTISAETSGDTAVYLANTTANTSISGKVTGGAYGIHSIGVPVSVTGETSATSGEGIYLLDCTTESSIVCNVTGTTVGVHLSGAKVSTINGTVSGDTAIKLESGASATTISGKADGTTYGVYADGATVGTISAETDGDTAVYLANTTTKTTISGKVTGSSYGVHADNAVFEVTSTAEVDGLTGIYLVNCTTENNIYGTIHGANYGIHVDGCKVGTINGTIDNTSTLTTTIDAPKAISLENGATAASIQGTVIGTEHGIYANNSTINEINAEVSGKYGVYLTADAVLTKVSGGSISGTSAGIYSKNSTIISIEGNGTTVSSISLNGGTVLQKIGGDGCVVTITYTTYVNNSTIEKIGVKNDTINMGYLNMANGAYVDVIGGDKSTVNITTTTVQAIYMSEVTSKNAASTINIIGGENSTVNITGITRYAIRLHKNGNRINVIGAKNSTVTIKTDYTARGDTIYLYAGASIGSIGEDGSTVIISGIRPLYLPSSTSIVEKLGCGKYCRVELIAKSYENAYAVDTDTGKTTYYSGGAIHGGTINELGAGVVAVLDNSANVSAATHVVQGTTIKKITGGYFCYITDPGNNTKVFSKAPAYAACHSLSTDTTPVTLSNSTTVRNCYYIVSNHTWGDDCVCSNTGCGIFKFHATNVRLGNNLDILFAFHKTLVSDWTGYYVRIVRSYADGTVDVYTVAASAFETYKIGETEYWVVTYSGFAAKEMCDEVTVTIYDASGNAVSIDKADSIQAYAMRMLRKAEAEKPAETTTLKTVIVDMLNYGAACQTHFGYNTSNMASKDLTDYQKYATAETPTVEDTIGSTQLTYWYGSNLVTDSNIQFAVAFKDLEEGMYVTYSFTGHKNNQEGNTVAVSDMIKKDGYSYFLIPELVVADARYEITITVKNGDTTLESWTESIEAYVDRNATNGDAFYAFMKFADSAHAYLHSGEVV